jgi:hypothetical protein
MTEKSIVDQSRRAKTGGRKAGTPNKVTAQLKEDILSALDGAGGVDYLQRVADSHPAAFLSLIGKVLPMTIAGAGPNGEHMFTKIVVEIIDSKA